MIPAEILYKKRTGQELNENEIRFLINGMQTGEVSDVQIAAFLTSACINGLSAKETTVLTFAMTDSGKKFNFSGISRPKVDKHSTGGVGDKLSFLLVPLVVPCGLAVPMISGRGLGHTGGTLDKLESIIGFDIKPTDDKFNSLMAENNCFIAAQTDDLVPADRKMYHIRDITGNIDSIGLITASILSKKFAEGLDGLVLDMKIGNGAFMRDFDSAKLLAESMANVARIAGLKMRIIFTSMDQPLGNNAGNWLEIEETLNALSGKCPDDLRQITEKLASAMLLVGGTESDENIAVEKIRKVWSDGTALEFFLKMIKSQGGNLDESLNKYSHTPSIDILAVNEGMVTNINTYNLGIAGIMLGAGRKKSDDIIDYGAGFIIHKKLGDEVRKGDKLLTLFANDTSRFFETSQFALKTFTIGSSDNFTPHKLILDEWII